MIYLDRTISALLVITVGFMLAGSVIGPAVSGSAALAVQFWRDTLAQAKKKGKEICDGSGLF